MFALALTAALVFVLGAVFAVSYLHVNHEPSKPWGDGTTPGQPPLPVVVDAPVGGDADPVPPAAGSDTQRRRAHVRGAQQADSEQKGEWLVCVEGALGVGL